MVPLHREDDQAPEYTVREIREGADYKLRVSAG